MSRIRLLLMTTLFLSGSSAHAASWHQGLCLGNGDAWRRRLPVDIRNRSARDAKGEQATVLIGRGSDQADLVGANVESLRVCNERGTEMIYNVIGPDGQEIHLGPMAAGSRLILPVECPAAASTRYWIYFDNPSAWGVPDWLTVDLGVRNGGFESGDGDSPADWTNDTMDGQHRIAWVGGAARSGNRCMQTTVDAGSPSTWVATRQKSLRIRGGARYVMRAWVKARDVAGYAGWYIHVGNNKNFMIISPMLSAGPGTYEWKEVSAEFTAPDAADRADLGTVLYGTGTAWYDDVELECLDPEALSAVAGPCETLAFTQVAEEDHWYDDNSDENGSWDYRFPLRVANYGDTPTDTGLISVDVASLFARLRGKADPKSLRVTLGQRVMKTYQLNDLLLIQGDPIPPRTVLVYHIYVAQRKSLPPSFAAENFTTDAATPALPGAQTAGPKIGGGPDYEALLNGPANLVANPSFETGRTIPDDWSGGGPGEHRAAVDMGLVQPGLFGERCVRMHVPHDSPPEWTGWRQDVRVESGKRYLYAAWLKCDDLRGSLQLHAHFRNAAGQYCETAQTASAGLPREGTVGWSLLAGLFTMPEDIAHFQLHLTMNATGTAWHDGVLLIEVRAGQIGRMQTRTGLAGGGINVWPVNPVVKVFQDDVPGATAEPALLRMARNEYEPLQLAVRSDRAVSGVRVQMDAPRSAAGTALDDSEVCVVGYVPIDCPTNYYRSDSADWVRKTPTAAPACDGWSGLWPDPLLPRDTFDLAADTTQPVWITFKTAADTPPGDYTGLVRFTSEGSEVARVPVRIHVWNFAVPEENHLAAIYDLRMTSRWSIPGKSRDETRRDFLKFMADRRVCPDTIEPAPDMRYEHGKVVADFTAFDRAAAYALDELGMPHFYAPWYFYLFGWGFPPSEKFGEKPYEGDYPYPGVDRGKLRPEFKQAYQAVLKTYWDHLKARGWDKKCVLYISDEPFYSQQDIIAQMKALCAMIHEVDPQIFIYSSTWGHVSQWDGDINCWGLGHYGIVSPDVISQRRAAGDRIRWTTDGQMCTDTPYCAIERLLPAYCFKYGAEAYEFWGINWLTYDPYRWGWHRYIFQSDTPENSYYVRYPNGDGYLAYPGATMGHNGPVSSIRLEQAREGCEDYEYLYQLRSLIAEAAAAGRSTQAAEEALAFAQELVTIPNAGGRYSTRILPDPDRVFTVRERVAAAIEQLIGK